TTKIYPSNNLSNDKWVKYQGRTNQSWSAKARAARARARWALVMGWKLPGRRARRIFAETGIVCMSYSVVERYVYLDLPAMRRRSAALNGYLPTLFSATGSSGDELRT
ncbi:MAG: hypothetical protein ACK56I_23060, partial [bacterium]